MPGFVKTPHDEEKWSRSKEAASKSTSKGSKSYWALSNFIFHKMGKSENDQQAAEFYKNELQKSLTSLPSISTGTSVPSGTKIPKAKSMGKTTDAPSKFWKSELCKSESKFCKNENLNKTTEVPKGMGRSNFNVNRGMGGRHGIIGGMGIGVMSGGMGMMLNEKNIDKSENEKFNHMKHPTLCKLRDLLKKNRYKNKV